MNANPVGANGTRKIIPIDDKPAAASIFTSGKALNHNTCDDRMEAIAIFK